MNRYRVGCPACGIVLDIHRGVACECECDLVPLPTATDVLAFKLRMSGRVDEATGVEYQRAAIEEMRGC